MRERICKVRFLLVAAQSPALVENDLRTFSRIGIVADAVEEPADFVVENRRPDGIVEVRGTEGVLGRPVSESLWFCG